MWERDAGYSICTDWTGTIIGYGHHGDFHPVSPDSSFVKEHTLNNTQTGGVCPTCGHSDRR